MTFFSESSTGVRHDIMLSDNRFERHGLGVKSRSMTVQRGFSIASSLRIRLAGAQALAGRDPALAGSRKFQCSIASRNAPSPLVQSPDYPRRATGPTRTACERLELSRCTCQPAKTSRALLFLLFPPPTPDPIH
jgi:hypothetical protein